MILFTLDSKKYWCFKKAQLLDVNLKTKITHQLLQKVLIFDWYSHYIALLLSFMINFKSWKKLNVNVQYKCRQKSSWGNVLTLLTFHIEKAIDYWFATLGNKNATRGNFMYFKVLLEIFSHTYPYLVLIWLFQRK